MQRKRLISVSTVMIRRIRNNASIHWARPIKMLLKQNCYLSLFKMFDF